MQINIKGEMKLAEPIEPEPPMGGGGNGGGEPPEPPGPKPLPEPPRQKIKVKLADGKARSIQSMTATTFWSADGRPMSAAQFLEALYGALPEFFKDEDQLRSIWSVPDTRKALLAGLAEKGFGKEPLAEMQRIIEAENSDLFDVLAYVAFAVDPVTRACLMARCLSFDSSRSRYCRSSGQSSETTVSPSRESSRSSAP